MKRLNKLRIAFWISLPIATAIAITTNSFLPFVVPGAILPIYIYDCLAPFFTDKENKRQCRLIILGD